ncbi:MAG TPA: Type 1 glutamine amidotransferase-like domain-containing protein [Rectinemataceae bacterium]|nr:Type 1 glutamine amidotransferase-like domain-containing protein [Rectinemataceae bacterium]
MGTIVAIGGGEIRLGETFAIDRAIVEMTGRACPRHLFIPTASGEPEAYIQTVADVYGRALGCECEALRLKDGGDGPAELRRKLQEADIIYVGGGDTRMMLGLWRNRGVDVLLREALDRGAILSGLSAGSVCWFERAVSDSNSFEGGEDWDYCHVACLGFISGTQTPHYGDRKSEERFRRFMSSASGKTLAIDNNCAIVIEGGDYRLIRSRPDSNAYVLRTVGGELSEESLEDRGGTDRFL